MREMQDGEYEEALLRDQLREVRRKDKRSVEREKFGEKERGDIVPERRRKKWERVGVCVCGKWFEKGLQLWELLEE